jgi:hypothetical protein
MNDRKVFGYFSGLKASSDLTHVANIPKVGTFWGILLKVSRKTYIFHIHLLSKFSKFM